MLSKAIGVDAELALLPALDVDGTSLMLSDISISAAMPWHRRPPHTHWHAPDEPWLEPWLHPCKNKRTWVQEAYVTDIISAERLL